MNDSKRPFVDMMRSWTKLQEDAWRLQSKMFEDAAGGGLKEDAQEGEAPKDEGPEGTSPFDELWARSREAFEKWGEYLEAAMPAGAQEGIGAEMLSHLLDPGAWLNICINELNQTIEQLSEGAQFADLWQAERRILSASREWLELRQQSLRYRCVILAAWMRAFERFYETRSAEFAEGGAPPSDWHGLVRAWLEIANDELLRTQRSEEFLRAQRDLLRASIDFRGRQRDFVEEFCETHAIPTRTEVDDLHRTVTELRRAVRALKSELAEARAAAAPRRPACKPARKGARPAASKAKAPKTAARAPEAPATPEAPETPATAED